LQIGEDFSHELTQISTKKEEKFVKFVELVLSIVKEFVAGTGA
jgi:hypothetical protein